MYPPMHVRVWRRQPPLSPKVDQQLLRGAAAGRDWEEYFMTLMHVLDIPEHRRDEWFATVQWFTGFIYDLTRRCLTISWTSRWP